MGRCKQLGWIVCAGLILFGGVSPVLAQEESSSGNGPLRKLGRGIANIATCPVELLRTADAVGVRDGYIAGLTVGVLQGLWRTVLRGVIGVYEVGTFYAEIPPGYAPLIRPEFAFGDFNWSD